MSAKYLMGFSATLPNISRFQIVEPHMRSLEVDELNHLRKPLYFNKRHK